MDKNTEQKTDSFRNVEIDFLSLQSAEAVPSGLAKCLNVADERSNDSLVDTNLVKRRIIQSEENDSDQSSRLSTCSTLSLEREDSINDHMDILSIHDSECFNDMIFQQDADGDNLLFLSIIDGRIQLTMHLISLVCDVQGFSFCNKRFQTALHVATLMNMPTVVRRLVVAGANVDLRDSGGNTALHIACKHGHFDVAEVLLTPVTYQETKLNSYEIPYQQIPQNLEIRNSDGLTCLHLAVLDRNEETIALLLSKDADINAVEMKAGKTSLHIAAENGDNHTVYELLRCSKLAIDKETFAGYTAAELACYRGHEHVEIVLSVAGASPSRSIETVELSRVLTENCGGEESEEIIEISSDDDDVNDDNDDAFAK